MKKKKKKTETMKKYDEVKMILNNNEDDFRGRNLTKQKKKSDENILRLFNRKFRRWYEHGSGWAAKIWNCCCFKTGNGMKYSKPAPNYQR